MKLDGDDLERLDRYVSGQGTTSEREELEGWVAADRTRRALAERMRSIGVPPQQASALDVAASWIRVQRRLPWVDQRFPGLVTIRGLASRDRYAPRLRQVVFWVAGVAASIVVTLGAAWFVKQRRPSSVSAATAPSREIVTPRGQRAVFTLTDGTRVMLGAASRLQVPAGYGRASRELSLDGQAYFDVAHDSLRPFRVRTVHGVAEDVGTAFVVTAYPETDGMRVAVVSGVVALGGLEPQSKPLLLNPGEHARVDSTGVVRVDQGVDIGTELAWTRGQLVFRHTPLRHVVSQLERWYGVRIRLTDTVLGNTQVSTTLSSEGAYEALAFLAAATGARLIHRTTSDSVFTLSPR